MKEEALEMLHTLYANVYHMTDDEEVVHDIRNKIFELYTEIETA